MMGFVWCAMLALSLTAALVTGQASGLTKAAMDGASGAITLCISLAGAMCLWCGFAKVMEKAGLLEKLGKLLRPILERLFPKASQDKKALGYLSANVSANLLGLGNAATPMGIAAVNRMQKLSNSTTATDEMCLLVVINTASIQILPTTVASVRASLGASSAFDILPAVWISSVLSVSAGILAAKILRRIFHA